MNLTVDQRITRIRANLFAYDFAWLMFVVFMVLQLTRLMADVTTAFELFVIVTCLFYWITAGFRGFK